ncbi:MAG: hypothetical protein RIE73_19885 [Coleofasciculus sp. C1-SOL-03]
MDTLIHCDRDFEHNKERIKRSGYQFLLIVVLSTRFQSRVRSPYG